jgi:hypothetical protein
MRKDHHTEWLKISAQIVICSSTIYFFSFITADPDLWGHIKFGEDLFAAGRFVWSDPYSFTAYNQPWINHEWIAELIFYFTYRFGSDTGLLIVKLVIGLCVVGCLFKTCHIREHLPLAFTIIMVLAIFVISPGFMIRPQIFSFLFFTLFVHLLFLFFIKGKNYLFILPLLMIVWVNFHGGFLIGWVLIGTVIFWQTLVGLVSYRNTTQLKLLWIWGFITSLAVLANPYGYKLLIFLYNSLATHRDITEWRPIIWGDLSFLRFKIMVCLFLFTLVINIKKSNGWEVCAILITLYAALRHQRHTPFFAIMCTPYLVHNISLSLRSVQKKFQIMPLSKTARNSLSILILAVVLYQSYHIVLKHVTAKGRIILNPMEYPVSAIHFLKLNNIKGDILLPFAWGEYAIWKLHPDCRVSIDGRFRTVYDESIIQAHLLPPDDIEKWRSLINKYSADILLARQSHVWQNFIKNNKQWIYVYSDKTAIVFLRRNITNNNALNQFYTTGLQYPQSPPSIYFP